VAEQVGPGDFTALLLKLYVAAEKPSYGQIRVGCKPVPISPASLASWLDGGIPRKAEVVAALFGYLKRCVGEQVKPADLVVWEAVRAGSQRARARGRRTRGPSPSTLLKQTLIKLPRVRDVPASDIAVHPPIRTGPPAEGTFYRLADPPSSTWAEPVYVRRDHDTDLAERLTRAAGQGHGLVVLVGHSCSGKTRSAWEAVRVQFGAWRFADVREFGVLDVLVEDTTTDGLLIWLDDLQSVGDLTRVAQILRRRFRTASPTAPVVAVATSWHGLSTASDGREALSNLIVIPEVSVVDDWSRAELARTAKAAQHDRHLRMALTTDGFGITQTLAGAPWLFEQWRAPKTAETKALLTAAIDLHRLGVDLLNPQMLERCATGYLSRSKAIRQGWFTEAWAEATTPVRDTVVALTWVVGGNDFRLCDLLQDYGAQHRHWVPIPEHLWRALTDIGLTFETLNGLAKRARNRMLYRTEAALQAVAVVAPRKPVVAPQAPVILSTPKQTPHASPPPSLPPVSEAPQASIFIDFTDNDRTEADRLLAAGDLEALHRLAIPSGDGYVRRRLAFMLRERGDYEGLLNLAIYSRKASRELVEWLCAEGRVEELLRQVVCGNGFAYRALNNKWKITGFSDSDRKRILKGGLHPDGTPASAAD
jgi:hypothetical protein